MCMMLAGGSKASRGKANSHKSLCLHLCGSSGWRAIKDGHAVQVWLQEFCWTEEEKQRKMDRRNRTMAEDQRAEIEKEPMFCMETMLNCLYWSLLIYDFDEVSLLLPHRDDNCLYQSLASV